LAKTKKKSDKQTPLMKQYWDMKRKYPDTIMLFRVGDFYETFAEDAVKAADVLGIILTSRNNGGNDVALAGFPYHSLDIYLPKLVKAGYRVAICEQLEKPSPKKKVVKRGVTEVVTPGISTNDSILSHDENNYLASIFFEDNNRAGLALLDFSTGEFYLMEGDLAQIENVLHSFHPSEILHAKDQEDLLPTQSSDQYTYGLDPWVFQYDYGREKLISHFNTKTLKGYGIEDLQTGQIAAGAILHYLNSTGNKGPRHISNIRKIQDKDFVWLDNFSIRNLELLYPYQSSGIPLIRILDTTVTPMGSRLLKQWLVMPLVNIARINERLSIVSHFVEDEQGRLGLQVLLKKVADIERIASKIATLKAQPRELIQLKNSLLLLNPISEILNSTDKSELKKLSDQINPCEELIKRVESQLIEDAPVNLAKGNVIADGYNEQLDEYRTLINNAKSLLIDIQQREIENTGIANLKIGFNNVFGYYLEVTNRYKNQGLIPDNWVRKQTLTNAERYITDELKQVEDKILHAQTHIQELEEKLYNELINWLTDYIQAIQQNARLIATLDVLSSFAINAVQNDYCRPEINDGYEIDIKDGRHPVIEQQMDLTESYIPNDVRLDNESKQLLVITGPNMSGKSAFLRQTALICLMAQMGSFVPASHARIGYIDKLFTRVGASDNISSGESTFMVEMHETAGIMNNISERSLIILDEIGRGTSTYDGISIAWSLAEFLINNPLAHPKTLFATHYHELNELANRYDRIKNYHVSTKEIGKKVLFLRKLVEGGSQHSFGIHVAAMAGMPSTIVERANEILKSLEQKTIEAEIEVEDLNTRIQKVPESYQLSIFETTDPSVGRMREILEQLNLNAMTPIDCMIKLAELKKLTEE
jgi:DNA mismatch repair protein MutS